ncbi:MAG: hypothetical protein OEM81_00890 [Acidimicrobiia bacterium]|nr:hypothetical protein [Acidimicrobiia bacterium]MDH3396366.1 hypothetical protein [Acidimicrobiia bacterium]MDH5616936.1 hypothetical protein [Acidimicrobiia bacterium]
MHASVPDSLEELRKELSDIQKQLYELPADAFQERVTLHDRQVELRALAGPLHMRTVSTDDLLARLTDLERHRDALLGDHLDMAHTGGATGAGGGGGGAGIDLQNVMKINEAIDRSSGRAALEKKIQEIRVEIRRRAEKQGQDQSK